MGTRGRMLFTGCFSLLGGVFLSTGASWRKPCARCLGLAPALCPPSPLVLLLCFGFLSKTCGGLAPAVPAGGISRARSFAGSWQHLLASSLSVFPPAPAPLALTPTPPSALPLPAAFPLPFPSAAASSSTAKPGFPPARAARRGGGVTVSPRDGSQPPTLFLRGTAYTCPGGWGRASRWVRLALGRRGATCLTRHACTRPRRG